MPFNQKQQKKLTNPAQQLPTEHHGHGIPGLHDSAIGGDDKDLSGLEALDILCALAHADGLERDDAHVDPLCGDADHLEGAHDGAVVKVLEAEPEAARGDVVLHCRGVLCVGPVDGPARHGRQQPVRL